MLSVPAGWVLVPVADLRVLADLRQHIHQHEPDRVKWEGEWHYGPLATAFISTIEAVADAADTMLAATPAPPIEGRDADVERVAREAANGLDWDKVYAAARKRALNEVTGTSYDEYLAREIADRIARAALQALGERG
ncbi:hypothetical protein ASE59_11500 [Sphingomonas sp. Leaf10]|nr:hypothetical protein ASE59_11500 [Sphingomonas sp. Leaf10]